MSSAKGVILIKMIGRREDTVRNKMFPAFEKLPGTYLSCDIQRKITSDPQTGVCGGKEGEMWVRSNLDRAVVHAALNALRRSLCRS